jgi:hypothetical protein
MVENFENNTISMVERELRRIKPKITGSTTIPAPLWDELSCVKSSIAKRDGILGAKEAAVGLRGSRGDTPVLIVDSSFCIEFTTCSQLDAVVLSCDYDYERGCR